MQLPEKTFLSRRCALFESDFECNRRVKPFRVMQFLQDIATDHAQKLGLGWSVMNNNGMLWVLSKIKVVFHTPVTPQVKNFTLYTWPLAPVRLIAERCFVAESHGTQLFSATSFWTIISHARKILPAETMNEYYHGEYSAVHSSASADFVRVRFDETFQKRYERTVLRSDLDQNGHVNNTGYALFALDVLEPQEEIAQMEISFQRELKLNDLLQVFSKREGNTVSVCGLRGSEVCFTSTLTLCAPQ